VGILPRVRNRAVRKGGSYASLSSCTGSHCHCPAHRRSRCPKFGYNGGSHHHPLRGRHFFRNNDRSQNELYYAAALTAYTMATAITVTVHQSECEGDRPKIVGIMLKRETADLPGRVSAIQDSLFSLSFRLDTLEQRVNDVNNQTNQLIAQRADQSSAQGNQIASKVDQVDQLLLGMDRQFRDASGRTLINLVDSIATKVGAP
jgi:hypothetical protein